MKTQNTMKVFSLIALLFICQFNAPAHAGSKDPKQSKTYHKNAQTGKRPAKILAIGNSWSVNGTAFLGEILDNLGIPVDLQLSYKGGCPLSIYWENTTKEELLFRHDYWTKEKGWERGRDKKLHTIKEIVTSDDFDVMTMQQASHDAGRYFTYQPYANNFMQWLNQTSAHQPVIFFQATWAYPDGSTHKEFWKYEKSSDKMYNAVIAATDSLMQETGIYRLMPSCPTIQQVRQIPGIPTVDTPDGTHLSKVGEYAASCVWAESLLRHFYSKKFVGRKNIKDCTYKIDQLTEEQAQAIRQIAYEIVANLDKYFTIK